MESDLLNQILQDSTLTTENARIAFDSFCETIEENFKKFTKPLKLSIRGCKSELKSLRTIQEKTEKLTKKSPLDNQPWKITASEFKLIESLLVVSIKKKKGICDTNSTLPDTKDDECALKIWGEKAIEMLFQSTKNIEQKNPKFMATVYMKSIKEVNPDLKIYGSLFTILKLNLKMHTPKKGIDLIRKELDLNLNQVNAADYFFSRLAFAYLLKQLDKEEIGYDILGKTFLQEIAKIYQEELHERINKLETQVKELTAEWEEINEKNIYISTVLIEPLSKNLNSILEDSNINRKSSLFALFAAEWFFLLEHESLYFKKINKNSNNQLTDLLNTNLKKIASCLFYIPEKTIEYYKKIAPRYECHENGMKNIEIFKNIFYFNVNVIQKELINLKKQSDSRQLFQKSFIEFYLKNTYYNCLYRFISITARIQSDEKLEINLIKSNQFIKENAQYILYNLTKHGDFLYSFYILKYCIPDAPREDSSILNDKESEKIDSENQMIKSNPKDIEEQEEQEEQKESEEQMIIKSFENESAKNKNVVPPEMLYAFMKTKTISELAQANIYKTFEKQYQLERKVYPSNDSNYLTFLNESEVDFWRRQLKNSFPNTDIILDKYPRIDLKDICLIKKIVNNSSNFKKNDWDNIVILFERLGGNVTQNNNGSEMTFSYAADNLYEYNLINNEYKKVSKISDVIDKPHGKQVNHKMLGKGKKWKALLERLGFTQEALETWESYLVEIRSLEIKSENMRSSHPSIM
jgi:hypothetical protein